jgi:hypothetical protein
MIKRLLVVFVILLSRSFPVTSFTNRTGPRWGRAYEG